jgi:lysine 2,3-aminomutase
LNNISNSIRDRFVSAAIGNKWQSVPADQWNDWTWQQRQRVRTLKDLENLIVLTEDERVAYTESVKKFMMSITPYYASLMDPEDPNCPIRRQAVPAIEELYVSPNDRQDPLGEEKDMPVPGITHRYPDRVLFYTTHNCAMYCRFCTRKRKVADPSSSAQKTQLEMGLEYIRSNPQIRDVVISGGDPLSNSDERLEYIISSLRAIPHVEVFRLGTRNLVTLPQRITTNLVNILKKYHPVYINTHFNHPKECTQEAFDACQRLADAGCIIGNQMVLLRGINDDPKTVLELNHKLLLMRVRPYYIYQCDMSEGISHFRTPVEKGLEIIENLRGWTSGLAVPHFVVDAPGGGGKIPMLPEYVESRKGTEWVLRNYQKKTFTYHED